VKSALKNEDSHLTDAISKAVIKMEKFKEQLREYLAKQTENKISLTFEEMEDAGIQLPSTSVSIPGWWSNFSVRAKIWREVGWKTKVTVKDKIIVIITFIRGEVTEDFEEIEDLTPSEQREEEVLPSESQVQKLSAVAKKSVFSRISQNLFGIISILLGIFAFYSHFNIFTYTSVVNICLAGIIIGLLGTKFDKKPTLGFIGVVLCMGVLFIVITTLNMFLEELSEE
jgi:hypothetical protein